MRMSGHRQKLPIGLPAPKDWIRAGCRAVAACCLVVLALTRAASAQVDTNITSGPNDPTSDPSASFQYQSVGPAATFECELDGGGWTACGVAPSGSQLYSGLADGLHAFGARALDGAGMPDPTPATWIWTIDTVAPDTQIDSGPPDPSPTDTATFMFSDPTGDAVAFECSIDGGALSEDCSSGSIDYTSLSETTYTFSVRSIDAAGNVDPSPATWTWTVDLAPAVPQLPPLALPVLGGLLASVGVRALQRNRSS